MRHTRLFSCALLTALLAPAAPVLGDDPAAEVAPPADFVTIEYGTGLTATGEVPLLLDLFGPPAPPATARPVVVAIHGGSFRNGSRADANLAAIARRLVPQGFTVLSISYRLSPQEPVLSAPYAALVDDFMGDQPLAKPRPRAFFEAMLAASEDLAKALRWIGAHAGRHGLDPQRVFLIGSSAGAIAALNSVYGLPARLAGDAGVRIAGVVDLWGSLPAVSSLPADGPPLLIIHGDADPTVPVAAAHRLVQLASQAGIRHTAHIMPGQLHGWRGNPPFTTEAAPGTTLYAAVEAFLIREAGSRQPE